MICHFCKEEIHVYYQSDYAEEGTCHNHNFPVTRRSRLDHGGSFNGNANYLVFDIPTNKDAWIHIQYCFDSERVYLWSERRIAPYTTESRSITRLDYLPELKVIERLVNLKAFL